MPPFFKQKKQKKADQNDRGNEDRKEPENKSDKERDEPISLSLKQNMKKLSERFGNSADVVIRADDDIGTVTEPLRQLLHILL